MRDRFNIPEQLPEFAQPIEVVDGVFWIRLPLPYQLDHVNIYLIDEGDGWAVLDAGIKDPACIAAWVQMLEGPLKGFKFKRLIVTHYHPDHMGLALWLCQRLDVPLYMSRSEYLFGQYLSHSPVAVSGDFHRKHFTLHGMGAVQQTSIIEHGHSYLRLISGLPDSYTPLADRSDLALGGRQAQVMTGGGHSLEQVMLHLPAEGLFFAADQVIERISPNVSVLASEPEANPLGEFLTSLQRISETIVPETLGLSGHRRPIFNIHQRIAEISAHHQERCDFLEDLLSKTPMTLTALTPRLFTRPLDAHQFSFAFAESLAHLNLLLARKKLAWTLEAGRRIYHPID